MSHTASKTYRYYNQMALEIIKDQGVIREILKLIHAHSGGITTSNSASVTFTGDGSASNPLSATAIGGGGLSSVTTTNSSNITFSGNGTSGSPLTGVVTTAYLTANLKSFINWGKTVIAVSPANTVYTIPHNSGMLPQPTSFAITFSDASDTNLFQSQRTIDANNITITCANPPTFTGNVTIYWQTFR